VVVVCAVLSVLSLGLIAVAHRNRGRGERRGEGALREELIPTSRNAVPMVHTQYASI
jgi:hypothetical protein